MLPGAAIHLQILKPFLSYLAPLLCFSDDHSSLSSLHLVPVADSLLSSPVHRSIHPLDATAHGRKGVCQLCELSFILVLDNTPY